MQKFPKNSKDLIESEYGKIVIKLFPSYKNFWEKFIGVDISKKESLLPKKPSWPRGYSKKQQKKFRENQLWFSKVSYSTFFNLVVAEKKFEIFSNIKKLNDFKSIFTSLECCESIYLYIGNVKFALPSFWGRFKNKNILDLKYSSMNFEAYLKSRTKIDNWNKLKKDPMDFRNCIVHNFKYIYFIDNGKLYLPNKVNPKKILWEDMKFDYWKNAKSRLREHIEITYRTCEDVFQSIIPIIDFYYEKEKVRI